MKLPAPKNLFAEDVVIASDVAILETSKSKITYRGSYNTQDPLEDAMMNSRWKTFTFHHQFSEADQKHTPPCGRCFSLLVMGNR